MDLRKLESTSKHLETQSPRFEVTYTQLIRHIQFMKHYFASMVILSVLLVWQHCLAADNTRYEVDVCVYGGTASGVMAALASEKEGADVMIYDAMYTDDEYDRFVGWGHSTWQKGIELALDAGVACPVLFHHDPRRSDDELDEIGLAADAAYPGTLVASEGMLLTP